MPSTGTSEDAIVIGSGMGGLSCAAALAHCGRRVLVLEQHSHPGGLTQTFQRDGFRWDVGVHYLGEMAPGGAARHLIDWLSDAAIEFAPLGPIYDTVHFPDGFEFAFSRPKAALRVDLKERFPGCEEQIDAFFKAMSAAGRAGRGVMMRQGMPGLAARLLGVWDRAEIDQWWGRTSAEVVDQLVSDPRLRAVLLSRQGDYGGLSTESSFGMHATLMRHYADGAYYPVGGAGVLAERLGEVIRRAGGEIRLGARVQMLQLDGGKVTGVRLADGTAIDAGQVFSAVGAHNTVAHFLPPGLRESPWAREVLSFKPSVCHVALYLGLQGDIRANGATASNHWFHHRWNTDASSWDIDGGAAGPGGDQPPSPDLFVSFASLRDPGHQPGPQQRHTAQVLAFVPWDAFSRWQDSSPGERPAAYEDLKARIERHLLARFREHFPALAPRIVFHELSTPLSTLNYTGAHQGAIYGLEPTPRRFLSDSLRAATPVPGLYLAGQDVACPGVTGAMWGGVFAAAAVEARVWGHLLGA